MPNFSARMGLKKPVATDPFDTDDLAGNWELLDHYPGAYISNNASPPVWGTSHIGMLWSVADTGIIWRWNGVAFERLGPSGSIGAAQRTSDFTENTGAFQTVVQKTGAIVPDGGRRVMIVVNWADLTGDAVEFQILRGATVLHDWLPQALVGGSFTVFDAPTAGSYTYALKVKSLGTTSTVVATATAPIQLECVEI